ncbi:Laminin b type iv, partial [Globisporangium splendens]
MTNGVDTSKEGIITITTNEGLVASTFDRDVENWSIVSNGNAGGGRASFQPISRGRLLSYYIYGIDAVIHQKSDTGDDAVLWYFSAPSKFLGNQWSAYGGSLDFVLSSAEGSFDKENLNLFGRGNLVILECSTCDRNAGITYAMPLSPVFSYDGTTTQFRLPLNELAGWVKDPKNIILPWSQPTQCEFVSVLSALTSLRILGDFTRGYESVALDSVMLRHGPGKPLPCYTSTS